jgi:hypothetical protein
MQHPDLVKAKLYIAPRNKIWPPGAKIIPRFKVDPYLGVRFTQGTKLHPNGRSHENWPLRLLKQKSVPDLAKSDLSWVAYLLKHFLHLSAHWDATCAYMYMYARHEIIWNILHANWFVLSSYLHT